MTMTIYMVESYDWDGNLKARKFAWSLDAARKICDRLGHDWSLIRELDANEVDYVDFHLVEG